MLSVGQRLVGLYILFETYPHETVKTTPFATFLLNLLIRLDSLHLAERRLLVEYSRAGPKIGKHTPAEYVKEAERLGQEIPAPDLELFRQEVTANLIATDALSAASVAPTVRDDEEQRAQRLTPPPYRASVAEDRVLTGASIDSGETQFAEFLPALLLPVPQFDPSYIVQDVRGPWAEPGRRSGWKPGSRAKCSGITCYRPTPTASVVSSPN
jgi:hypothetical protein